MRIYIISAFLLLFSTNLILAQNDLKTQLKSKETLHDIMQVVNDYYAGKDDEWKGEHGDDPKLKHWKRWEYYMSSRLGRNGELIKIQDSLLISKERLDKLYPADKLRSINSTWTPLGPLTTDLGIARADRIAFHPSNPNIFYVGTPAGGLWKTTTGGTSWIPLTDHIPSIGISGIVVDWNNPSTIYILTGDGDSALLGGYVFKFGYARKSIGVLKSTDSGNTWKQTGLLDANEYLGFKLVQSPLSPNTLLAATSNGVFRTTNGGATWQNTLNEDIYDVEFKPGNNVAYAAGKDKIFYSLFGGSSWAESTLDVNLVSPNRIELAVTPAQNGYVYALIGDVNSPGIYGGTYRSDDSGITYELMGNTPNILGQKADGSDSKFISAYCSALAVSNSNSNKLAVGSYEIWTSSDGGETYPNQKICDGGDVHELAYNPLNGKLYSCNDTGVYVSEDDGENWTPLRDGFAASQIYHLAGTPLDDNYFLVGLQDNGVKLKTDATTFWTNINGSDGFDGAFNPIDHTEFYATINQGAKRFSNGGANQANIGPPNSSFFGRIRTHVSNENIVFIGYDTLLISNNKGDTWNPTTVSGSWAIETCPSNSSRLYVAGASDYQTSQAGTLSRSDDVGVSWTSLEDNTGFPDSTMFNKITDIAVNPGNSSSVYATFGGFIDGIKVYRSGDAGATWENYSGSLPNIPINAVVINAAADQVYIGTDLGVFYRHSSMNDWMPFNNKLPNIPVTDLYINENTEKIIASTFGRGAWQADLADGCPNNIALGGNLLGFNFYQAGSQITATTNHNGGFGTEVFFKAGNRVILKPGFFAKSYTAFKAYIGGCGEGEIPE